MGGIVVVEVICYAYCVYPSSCGMFVYGLVTSIDTRIVSSGIFSLL